MVVRKEKRLADEGRPTISGAKDKTKTSLGVVGAAGPEQEAEARFSLSLFISDLIIVC